MLTMIQTGFLILFFQIAFQQNQTMDISSIELTLRTRGSSKMIRVSPDNIISEINGQSKKVKTEMNDWTQIMKNLKELNLADLGTYKSKPVKSQVDASYMARICIRTKTNSYESADFDESNPPAQLKKTTLILSRLIKEME